MIAMVMGDQNGEELEIVCFQILNDRSCITWIDNYGLLIIVNYPDIVIFKCGYGEYFRHCLF